jgi:hypothetical protein
MAAKASVTGKKRVNGPAPLRTVRSPEPVTAMFAPAPAKHST